MKTLTATQIANYTNARLNNWYDNAKEDYSVNGQGSAVYNEEKDMIVITYTEDGLTGVFELGNFQTEAIDWVFNVWSEMANLEDDKIEVTPEYRTSFTDCDDFATYILDSILWLGYESNAEFNEITGIDLPVGTDLYRTSTLPRTDGKNFKKFRSVRSWLYDIYEEKFVATKKKAIRSKLPNYIFNSPLLEACTFKNGEFVNLIKAISTNKATVYAVYDCTNRRSKLFKDIIEAKKRMYEIISSNRSGIQKTFVREYA